MRVRFPSRCHLVSAHDAAVASDADPVRKVDVFGLTQPLEVFYSTVVHVYQLPLQRTDAQKRNTCQRVLLVHVLIHVSPIQQHKPISSTDQASVDVR